MPEWGRKRNPCKRSESTGQRNRGISGFCERYIRSTDISRTGEKWYISEIGDQLYLAPKGMPSVKGLKVLRPGLHLGTVKKNRMEPSHALALALKKEQVRYTADLASDGEVIRGYLNGGTFSYEGEKGWYLIMADGFSSGWGKLAGGIMKNHYPKGLRKMW